MVVSQLDQLIGARLHRITLYSASLTLDFEHGDLSLSLSTSCDFLVEGDEPGGDYPLSSGAFAQLTSTIDGCVEGLIQKADGNYELRVEGRVFIMIDEGAMDGTFRLSGRSEGQAQRDEFF